MSSFSGGVTRDMKKIENTLYCNCKRARDSFKR